MSSFESYVENKTIAVVGNAESLLDSTYGTEIDSYDIVLRMNKPPIYIDEYNKPEAHGEKIDIWTIWDKTLFINRAITKEHPPGTKLNDAWQKMKPNLLDLNMRGTRETINSCYYNNELFFGQYKKQMLRIVPNPSCGLCVLYILNKCQIKEVGVFGFDWKQTPTVSERHFFEKVKNGIDRRFGHDFNKERSYAQSNFFIKDNWTLYT